MIKTTRKQELKILLDRIEHLHNRLEINRDVVYRIFQDYSAFTKTPLDGALLDWLIKQHI